MNKASTPEERRGYEDSVKTYRDINNAIATAERDAEKRGEYKGREEEKLSNARKMKELGVGFDIIVQVTGLVADEIEKL